MAGFEVTPRSDSSRSSRSSSPEVIRLRRIWSSHTLVPAAVNAASLSFCAAPTLIARLLSGTRRYALDDRARTLGNLLGGEAEVLVEVGLGRGCTECRHGDRVPILSD